MVGVGDGVVDAGGGEEAAALGGLGLLSKEGYGGVAVPVLVEVSVFLVFEQEQFGLFIHALQTIPHSNAHHQINTCPHSFTTTAIISRLAFVMLLLAPIAAYLRHHSAE